ncbi:unnamed protein product [Schistocephalus solidus]|uniref:DUF2997 domain-containing protein n=1 Tax=Schistocephalus solidus TaxID=70667 RepID=A0A183T441_SCHSO|nr:unnamed protein product [Schistocephalus solidus]
MTNPTDLEFMLIFYRQCMSPPRIMASSGQQPCTSTVFFVEKDGPTIAKSKLEAAELLVDVEDVLGEFVDDFYAS